jgi:hypothetical protein
MGFLLLGIDSLIACFAVGALVSRRSWLSYAALFGVCDAGGFLLGTALHWSVSEAAANVVATAVMVGLGVYWLTIDNITYGLIDHAWSSSVAVQATEQLVSSALLALIGLVLSGAVVSAVPKLQQSRVVAAGCAGVALIVAAPLLLAIG